MDEAGLKRLGVVEILARKKITAALRRWRSLAGGGAGGPGEGAGAEGAGGGRGILYVRSESYGELGGRLSSRPPVRGAAEEQKTEPTEDELQPGQGISEKPRDPLDSLDLDSELESVSAPPPEVQPDPISDLV